MYFKKSIQKFPHKFAVAMLLAVIVLLFLGNKITESFTDDKYLSKALNLGLDYADEDQPKAMLQQYENCKLLEIVELKTKHHSLTNYGESRQFTIEKLNCRIHFNDSNKNIETSIGNNIFGAVEFSEGKRQIMLWINTNIFHSAGLTLNLAQNLILQ